MIRKYLSFALICLLLLTADSTLVSAQSQTKDDSSATEKIKANIKKRVNDDKLRVKVQMLNGTTLKGKISRTDDDSFILTDSKSGQTTSIAYSDVEKVTGGGLSKGKAIGLAIGIGAAATVAIIVLNIVSRYCNNEGC